MRTRDRARTLVLVVAEGATGSRATWSLGPVAFGPTLLDEFDVCVLDTDAHGDPTLHAHLGGGPSAAAGVPLTTRAPDSGALASWCVEAFGDDPPELIHVHSGASWLYKLGDLLDAWPAATIVSIEGWREAASARRRLADRLDSVDRWILDAPSTADHLAADAPPELGERLAVIEPGSDVVPRAAANVDYDAGGGPVRVGFVATRSPHTTLVHAERLAALLDAAVEVHVFGVAAGASRPAVCCHSAVPVELLADAFADAAIQVVAIDDGRAGTLARHAALATGAALLSAPTGATAELIRLTGAGWTCDPDDLAATAELLGTLATHRFELRRAQLAARAVKVPSTADHAARLAGVYRDVAGAR